MWPNQILHTLLYMQIEMYPVTCTFVNILFHAFISETVMSASETCTKRRDKNTATSSRPVAYCVHPDITKHNATINICLIPHNGRGKRKTPGVVNNSWSWPVYCSATVHKSVASGTTVRTAECSTSKEPIQYHRSVQRHLPLQEHSLLLANLMIHHRVQRIPSLWSILHQF